ncbi:MAG: LysR family transcriptional regulator [Desulfobacterales bacterium]|nr:LysR family transcriptional regulator [Desulfobacterales bacterium]
MELRQLEDISNRRATDELQSCRRDPELFPIGDFNADIAAGAGTRRQLFNRLGNRICLTEAGRMLVGYSQKLLDIEQETLSKVSGKEEPQGSISIRIPQSIATYLLPSVLSMFQARYPRVGFDVGTCAYEALIHETKTGITDLAFLLADSILFPELKTEVLRFERLVLVAESRPPAVGALSEHADQRPCRPDDPLAEARL